MVAPLSLEERAAHRRAGGRGAAAWMCAPCLPAHTLTDTQYRTAALRRTRTPPPATRADANTANLTAAFAAPTSTPTGPTRQPAAGGWRVKKHDAVKFVLANWAEEHGAEVRREQILPEANTNAEARLDLTIHHSSLRRPAVVDVTVVNPTRTEYLSKGSASRNGAAADTAELDKIRKYPGISVTPFAVEEFGRLGECAIRLIKAIAPTEPDERSKAINDIYRRISGIVQKISADAIISSTARTQAQQGHGSSSGTPQAQQGNGSSSST